MRPNTSAAWVQLVTSLALALALAQLTSDMLSAWKVSCRQQRPIPKPMASMYTWSGLAAAALLPSSPRAARSWARWNSV